MKKLTMLVVLALFGCHKQAHLTENYDKIIGTWSDPQGVTTVIFRPSGRITWHNSAQRGFSFKVNTYEEVHIPNDGSIRLHLSAKRMPTDNPLIVAINPATGRIRLISPVATDTLIKL